MSFLRTLVHDGTWTQRHLSARFLIAASTFAILALELALIRWTSVQFRILAYFSNLVLMVAFLGMGVGVALGSRMPGLVHLALPCLLLLSVPLAFSEALGWVHLRFPDETVFMWGAAGGVSRRA